MKKTLPIFLLVVFLAIQSSYFVFLYHVGSQRLTFRAEALHKPGNQVRVFQLPARDLYLSRGSVEWEDENQEIVLDGKFFEILSVQIDKDLATLLILADETEDKLFAEYFEKCERGEHSLLGMLLDMVSLTFLDGDPAILHFNSRSGSRSFANDFLATLSSYSAEINKPPRG